ncbi:unnamed protein product [Auanema sp. JU1783]|nr:unnamed protein product [Auanema sp. JU1783]
MAAIAKEEVLDLDYEEPIEQEESDSGEIPDSTPPSPSKSEVKEERCSSEKEEGELEEGEISDSEDEGEIKANGVDEYSSKGKIPITSRLSRPNTANVVVSFRKEGGSRKRKNRNNRNKLDRDKGNETSWERTLRSAREALTRDSQPRDSFQRSKSRSLSPESCQIPSLLDLQMSPPPKFNSSRVAPKDLGPQVIYPNGHPNRRKNENMRRNSGKNSLKHSPRRSPSKRQRESPGLKNSPPAKRQGFSPVRDASPISSESDSWTRDENFESKRKKNKADNVSSIISDPWARKKTVERPDEERKKRSSDRSSSSSCPDDRSISRSSSSSDDGRRKNKTKSPPRGDISYYRIPKKARQSAGSDVSSRRSRISGDSRNPGRSDFDKSNKYDRFKNRRCSPSELVEKISDSESDSENSKKRSSSGSASSRSSISRSSSPALPAKYRVNVSKPRSASPISEDDVDSRKSSVSPARNSPVKHKYVPDPVAVSPISDDSPEPEERFKEEATLGIQETVASKPRPASARTPSGSPPPSSPPAKKIKDEKVDSVQAEKIRRKQELQEELKQIEAELERKRASQSSSST